MEKNTGTIVATFAILSLLVGFTLGGQLIGEDTVTYIDKPIEKIINVSVDRIVEVPAISYKELAIAEFLEAVEAEEDEAGNDVDVIGTYDFDEIEVSKIYDDHNIEFDGDKVIVDFSIKLRFDEDGEASEKETYDVKVIFEDGEDTEVLIE